MQQSSAVSVVNQQKERVVENTDRKRNKLQLPRRFRNKRVFKKLRIATSIAAFLLLAFISWKVYRFYKLSPEKIYRQVVVSYPKSILIKKSLIGAGSIKESFVRKDYNEVVLLQKSADSFTNLDSLLIGISYLQLDEPGNAIKWLQPVSNNKLGMYQDGEFYLSLAYLMNKDYDPSIDLMQRINADSVHLYRQNISPKIIKEVEMVKWR